MKNRSLSPLQSSVRIQCSGSEIRTHGFFLDNIRNSVPYFHSHQSRPHFSLGVWVARAIRPIVDEQCAGRINGNCVGSGTDRIPGPNRIQRMGGRGRGGISEDAWFYNRHREGSDRDANSNTTAWTDTEITSKGRISRRRRVLLFLVCAHSHQYLDICAVGDGERASGIVRKERVIKGNKMT